MIASLEAATHVLPSKTVHFPVAVSYAPLSFDFHAADFAFVIRFVPSFDSPFTASSQLMPVLYAWNCQYGYAICRTRSCVL